MSATTIDRQEIADQLTAHNQSHVLQFWDELDSKQQRHLAAQIQAVNFEQLASLQTGASIEQSWEDLAARAELPPAITAEQFGQGDEFAKAVEAGSNAIKNGEVAAILVAGGQGSRLGFPHPKGMLPIGPLSDRSLYQIILEKSLARARQFDSTIPFYVMTSPPTHDESQTFLKENNYFGYGENDIQLFCQGVMPAIDGDGKLLLADKHQIFVSPDGHGGTLAALEHNGCLADMQKRGIKYVFYGQVDNPLIQICEPALIGYHILRQSEMTSQVVRKNEPLQKVGNVVSIDGKVQIIEYSDLPEEHARKTNDDGSLKLWAGSIAVHVFDLAFLERSAKDASSLPFHKAHKKVPFVDADGNRVEPDAPNATKFEKFIFDLLPSAKNAIVCEVDAAKGFCAVKNAPPAPSETPDHVKAAICDLHRGWLQDCGVAVADNIQVEINPLFAVDAEQLRAKTGDLKQITEDTYLI